MKMKRTTTTNYLNKYKGSTPLQQRDEGELILPSESKRKQNMEMCAASRKKRIHKRNRRNKR